MGYIIAMDFGKHFRRLLYALKHRGISETSATSLLILQKN